MAQRSDNNNFMSLEINFVFVRVINAVKIVPELSEIKMAAIYYHLCHARGGRRGLKRGEVLTGDPSGGN